MRTSTRHGTRHVESNQWIMADLLSWSWSSLLFSSLDNDGTKQVGEHELPHLTKQQIQNSPHCGFQRPRFCLTPDFRHSLLQSPSVFDPKLFPVFSTLSGLRLMLDTVLACHAKNMVTWTRYRWPADQGAAKCCIVNTFQAIFYLRAFALIKPSVWSAASPAFCMTDSLAIFRSQLKGFLGFFPPEGLSWLPK